MSITQRVIKFLASRVHIPGDALDYFSASARIGRGAETTLPFPADLIPIGARLVARGRLNHQFFPTQRDWILPYWAERQFDPRDPAFIPYGFDLFTLNYTHRDWTMVGNLAREREAIVDPRGLITPWFDGWSLDVWLQADGKLFAPSRLADADIEQSLHENLPMVVTAFRAGNLRVQVETFAVEPEDQNEFVVAQITVEKVTPAPQQAMLYVSVRPFNPEGANLIKNLEYRDGAFFVNGALGALVPKPDLVACSEFRDGDVALSLANSNARTRVQCPAGLATGVAGYRIALGEGGRETLAVLMPMQKQVVAEDDDEIFSSLPSIASASELRRQTIATWRDRLARGLRVRLPDDQMQNAFEANKAFLLLLHDGDTITPGPFLYHQFWFRDAAYMLNALDVLGYHDEVRTVIEKMPRRLQKDGYLRATEGEWDSNGAALWTILQHARLSGERDLIARHYWSILRMASWINSKRHTARGREIANPPAPRTPRSRAPRTARGEQGKRVAVSATDPAGLLRGAIPSGKEPHYGLLPPGPSAEHLGPSDYFYWDDFWGLAGLRAAAHAAEWLGQADDAKKLRANAQSFCDDIEASLAAASARLGRAAMPASPYRRLDAGLIGSLAALYPLRLFQPSDPRIVDTMAALKEVAWMEDAYFNHVGHAALGTYLSLHVAHCHLFQRNPEAWKIIQWVLKHASPTFTWAEGLHPITRRGGMGDGHHGWAAADFVLAVRDALLFEEGDHLVITPVLPEDWAAENSVIKVEDAPTFFGDVSYTIAFGERTGTLVLNADWREAPAYIEWNLPFTLRQAGGDISDVQIAGNTVRLPRDGKRVVVMW